MGTQRGPLALKCAILKFYYYQSECGWKKKQATNKNDHE